MKLFSLTSLNAITMTLNFALAKCKKINVHKEGVHRISYCKFAVIFVVQVLYVVQVL